MANLIVPWRSACFSVVTNWFLCNDVDNYDTMIVLFYFEIPPQELIYDA